MTDIVAERETFLQTLLDSIDVAVLACDAEGASVRLNRYARLVHGIPAADSFVDPSALHLEHLDGRAMAPTEVPLLRALRGGDVSDLEVVVARGDSAPAVRMRTQARRLIGPDGTTVGAVASAYDVTDLRATEAALRLSEDRFKRVFDQGINGKVLVEADGTIFRANQAFALMLGEKSKHLRTRSLSSCFVDHADRRKVEDMVSSGRGTVRGEMSLRSTDGFRLWVRVALDWVTEEDGRRLVLAQVDDVTARRRAEQRLTELALHDELTGLPNRRLLLRRLQQAFGAAGQGRCGTTVSVLFIDLDGFKAVNDRAGHSAGDLLLTTIATDVAAILRPDDTLARVGGDEFVVLLGENADPAHPGAVADRLSTTIRREIQSGEVGLPVSASIGIACVDRADEPDLEPEQLLQRADAAMYAAKERGRDGIYVFDSVLLARTEARYLLEGAVRDGLVQDGLSLVYQPVVDIDTGAVTGAEALMRLRGSDGALLPTLPAIMAADQAGLAAQVGDRVLHRALRTLRTWPEHLTVSVNVSTRELSGPDFHQRVERALRRHDVDPARLVLEFTETSLLRAGASPIAALQALRTLGVRVAVDDFGTGYATLQNLMVLPVDLLKVDSSFTQDLKRGSVASAIIHGVITMAREMKVPCIVEGIETGDQRDALLGLGVQGQGWLWGEPHGGEVTPGIPASRQAPAAGRRAPAPGRRKPPAAAG